MPDGVCFPWPAARASPLSTAPCAAQRPRASGGRGIGRRRSSHLPTSEDELVTRLRRGDADAFRLLVERYGDDLYRLACSSLGSEADACDLVQETLVGAFRGVARFDGRSSLRTWLLRILF